MRHVFGDPEIFQAVRAAKFKLVAPFNGGNFWKLDANNSKFKILHYFIVAFLVDNVFAYTKV